VTELATQKRTQIAGSKYAWEDVSARLAQLIPVEMPSDKILKQAFFLIRRNPKLTDCTPDSFAAELLRAHSLQLDPLLPNMCWLIPRKGVVTFQYGYLGLRMLAMRSGKYRAVFSHPIYEGDVFSLEYISGEIEHRPSITKRGKLLCVYAVAISHDGYVDSELMSVEQVNEIRDRSDAWKSGRSSPWKTDWNEMARKTVLKRLCKRLDLSSEAAQALAGEDVIDVESEVVEPVDLAALPVVTAGTALPAPVEEPEPATVEAHEPLESIPRLGKTTISKCRSRGINTPEQLWESIKSGNKPSGMLSESVKYLEDRFSASQPDPEDEVDAIAELVKELEQIPGHPSERMSEDLLAAGFEGTVVDATKAIAAELSAMGTAYTRASKLELATAWHNVRARI
jgi:recombination protein RecT